MRKFVLATALLSVGSVAMAADATIYAPVPTPPPVHPFAHQTGIYDWSGWYLGGYAGALVGGNFTHDRTGPGLSGVDAGASLQYNAVLDGNIVLSPFVAVTLPVQTGALPSEGAAIKVLWAAQAGARLGYAHGRFLPYVYAGGVIGAAQADTGNITTNTHAGYTLGAGFDYALDDRWTLGARYAFYSLGAKPYEAGVTVGWQGHSILATVSFKLH